MDIRQELQSINDAFAEAFAAHDEEALAAFLTPRLRGPVTRVPDPSRRQGRGRPPGPPPA